MTKIGNNASNSKQSTSVSTCRQDVYNPVYSSFFSTEFRVIDSLKIRIPFHLVSIENEVLGDEYVLVSTRTGEEFEDENFKSNAYSHKYNGITTHYKIEKQITRHRTVEEYLVILVTSKILQHDYFKGIQSYTILDVYNRLMNETIVYFTFESFMNGECTDVDIKYDVLPNAPVKRIVENLYEQVIPQRQAHKACSVYKQKSNLGIQFALRKTQAFLSHPYLKFYEKVRELNSKSLLFNETYLSGFQLPVEILRCETTIKNKKHFKALGQLSTTLKDIIGNLETVSKEAFEKAFKAHIMDYKEVNVNSLPAGKTMNTADLLVYDAVKSRMKMGSSFEFACIGVINSCAATKEQRYKLKKRIQKVFDVMEVPDVEKLTKFQEVNYWIDGMCRN